MTILGKLGRLLKRTRRDAAPTDRLGREGAAAPEEAPERLYQRASDHCARGELDAAFHLLDMALDVRPDWADAHFLQGEILRSQGRLNEASDCYVLATAYRPDLPAPYLQLGRIAFDQGRLGEALELVGKALALHGDDAVAHNVMGSALMSLERVPEAVEHFRRAVELKPDYADAHSNLGYVLFRDLAQFEEGARHIRTALDLDPENEAALCNWTLVLQQRGAFTEMLETCDRVLAANPAIHEVRLNRGLARLTLGRFREGWEDYEARKQARGFEHRELPWPEWDGVPLAGKTIYIASEQGLGDEIMFSSCVPDVISTAGGCVVECAPKLERLYRRSFPSAFIVPREPGAPVRADIPEKIDCQSAIGSLPRFFRNEPADFPQRAGYLVADAGRVAYWRGRLDEVPGELKVGISWRGGTRLTRSSLRSIALEQWLPVLNTRNTAYVCLQYTECSAELAALKTQHGIEIVHWAEAIDDYDETAALVTALDLIISVQTALVHLGGALGRPVWALVSTVPEWRYQASGKAMPWYPSVRVYRQETSGEWAGTLETVARDLELQRAAR